MDRLSERLDQLTPLQRAVFALKESQARLEAAERAKNEPIAIVGMACRFPGGGDSPEAFWTSLINGVDAIREVPGNRWDVDSFYDPDPLVPGKTNSRWGGFLDRIDGFDKQFFGISEREAVRMDPQQRILLELAWEALEDAGLPTAPLAGSRTGVFIGIAGSDYCLFQVGDPLMTDAFASTGTSLCIAANRISFAFDFRGPSIALDTACSSSLVAVHQACQSLRSGESTLALAGGVNLMLWPTTAVNLTKAGLSSPDGRCRSFDAAANGYVRSEGGGLIVLKPLAAAMADGDPIHAVIRGSAVNQDGQSSGMKTPNRQAQEAMLRQAYAQAGSPPDRVQYIETQGTGTLMGDMIEGRALGNVLTDGRAPGHPCLIGSVKTNIGHLETASGMAGLIKTVLALKHRMIPGNLHFETPNPHIPFDELSLAVVNQLTPWPETTGPALAGVSALGFGGTNAHVVLEETVAVAAEPPVSSAAPVLLPLSARSESALKTLARLVRETLKSTDDHDLTALARSAGTRRDHHDHRLALVARTRAEAIARLAAFEDGQAEPDLIHGSRPHDGRARVVFLFGDQAAGWWSAARVLREVDPTFRSQLADSDRLMETVAGRSLTALLDTEPSVQDPSLTRPALVALQVALASSLRQWGIHPVGVAGLGVGELAAACVAGALTLENALRVASQGSTAGLAIPTTAPAIPMTSLVDGRDLAISSWTARSTKPANTSAVTESLERRHPETLLEVGPPTLAGLIGDLSSSGAPAWRSGSAFVSASTVHDDLLRTLGTLYASGHALDWHRLWPEPGRFVRLPSYPWQRERCWIDHDVKSLGLSLTPIHSHETQQAHFDTKNGAEEPPGRWLYEVRWERQENEVSRSKDKARPAGRWLILGDGFGIGARLAELLEEQGESVTLLSGPWDQPVQAIRDAFGDGRESWDGIVHLWNLDIPAPGQGQDSELEPALELGCETTLTLLKELARAQEAGNPRLWIATRGAHEIGANFPCVAPEQAPVWGLGRTLVQEHPRTLGGLFDLDPDASIEQAAAQIRDELLFPDGEDQVAWRGGQRHVARLMSLANPSSPAPRSQPRFRADGTYLVTGGLGGLGRTLTHWMVEQGARRLILMGRTELPPRTTWNEVATESRLGQKIEAVRGLEALGASVHLAAVDVSDEGQLRSYLASFAADGWPPIRGVFHLAGTLDLRPLVNLDLATLTSMMRPKLAGGWLLHRLLSDQPIEMFVLFSSTVSVLGSPLLGGYGAASSALDALAAYRRSLGLPALAIDWGAWSATVAAPRQASGPADAFLPRRVNEFTHEDATKLLPAILETDRSRVVALPYTLQDWVDRPPIALKSPLLKHLNLASKGDRPIQVRPELSTPYEPPRTELEKWMATLWAEILKLDRVGIHDNFFELGGDSLQGAILLNRIQSHFQEILHLLAIFDTPHIAGLADYLRATYPREVKRLCPSEVVDCSQPEIQKPGRIEVIDRHDIERMRQAITARSVERHFECQRLAPKNPRAIFILTPPRSGSTLLRVMLAGHPRLFAPPELYLLNFNGLAERKRAFDGPVSYLLEGSVRALMEAKGWDAATAQEAIYRLEQQGVSTQDFYRMLQEAIGDRILVDKTPGYAMEPEALQRAEAFFEDPLYIHLLRHPCGMIRSYGEYRLDLLWNSRFQHPYTSRQLGEMVWINNHENILQFLETIPAERQFRLRFEELVTTTEATLRDLARFLGLDYDPAMAQPYQEQERRMVDGIAPESRMMGDVKFSLKHKAVDRHVADRWKEEMTGDFLGPPAREVAARLDYTDFAPLASRPLVEPVPLRADDRIERVEDRELEDRLDQLSDEEVEALLARQLSTPESDR